MKTPNYPSIVQFQQLVELKDYRGPTKKEYVRYVRKFAEHLQADPATATEDRLREYFLFLRQKKGYARSPMNVAKCALRCFYRECVQVTGWTVFEELRIAHPHVHCVVPAGGLAANGRRWVRPRQPDYFLPQAVLARRFRTRFQAALRQALPPATFAAIAPAVWRTDWVADVQPVGSGEPALKYLAAYVYRTAFSAERIVADDGQHVTFTYREGQTGRLQRLRLTAGQFLHRFLQHVLPRGFQRVRYFGWLAPAALARWERLQALLDWKVPDLRLPDPLPPPRCPCCQQPMRRVGALPRAPP